MPAHQQKNITKDIQETGNSGYFKKMRQMSVKGEKVNTLCLYLNILCKYYVLPHFAMYNHILLCASMFTAAQ